METKMTDQEKLDYLIKGIKDIRNYVIEERTGCFPGAEFCAKWAPGELEEVFQEQLEVLLASIGVSVGE